MLAPPEKPLLLVDVDGVISLFGFPAHTQPAGRFALVDGIAHFLSASAGEHLRRLADVFEPVWCTGWEEKANDHLPHLLGLDGPWPHLRFEQAAAGPGSSVLGHWKLAAIDAFAGARPLAWIDDLHGEPCERWAAARRAAGAPTLLVTTAPAVGLTEGDVERLLAWAAGYAATSGGSLRARSRSRSTARSEK